MRRGDAALLVVTAALMLAGSLLLSAWTSPFAGCARVRYHDVGEFGGVRWAQAVCDEYAPWARLIGKRP